ncbi:O-fucosyltransferase family protein [Raphanus sativus]|uniref:O-fucosyltransferase family protein n=1 Tax=Raphanus sativus TaxID=3726 RepID=A0A6J0KH46_RAPSA|nr:O-fucosyltransferase 5-like [Raphanus sativus]KAJ4879404.1 O-fucosyltransferase family protein [Raphanus sativus]
MDRDSSDDDADHRNLIPRNDIRDNNNLRRREDDLQSVTTTAMATNRTTGGGNNTPRSTFQIEETLSRSRNHRKNLVIVAAVSLTLLLLGVFFFLFTDTPRSSFKLDPLSVRAKESELRALYLLKQQQLALVSLLNRNSSNTIDESSLVIDNAISLSKEIEEVLLSPHRTGNSSSVSGLGTSDTSIYLCKKVDQSLSERRTIEWKPRPDKFLFAICLSGQMSNHLICLEKHMFFAALLDRVLVIPSPKFDYQYDRVIDIDRINTCLGRTVVVSFDQFKNKTARIDRFICYFSSPQPCYVDEEHVDKLKGLLGVTIGGGGKLESPWSEDIKKPSKRSSGEVVEKFKSEEGVIAIGDVFYADLERDWVMQPGGPINHKCKTLIEPSRLILLTAQRFIQTFLGKNFIALHLRRHGFLKFCNAKSPSCFYPIPQAADCISRIVERANAPVIYLSTDAAESETGLLQTLVVVDGKVVPLVKRPPRNSAEKWDSLLYRHGIEDDSQVDAMLDKTICAMSSVFIGASGSTFTEDILRLRKDWGTSSTCDEYLCRGEEPNFIAEDE